jgi:hypothetical protein
MVNAAHGEKVVPPPLSLDSSPTSGKVRILDLHYQSVKSCAAVLVAELGAALSAAAEVWLLTGTGHHAAKGSHQRTAAAGVLHTAVGEYLASGGYTHYIGKDSRGFSGCFLVVPARGSQRAVAVD